MMVAAAAAGAPTRRERLVGLAVTFPKRRQRAARRADRYGIRLQVPVQQLARRGCAQGVPQPILERLNAEINKIVKAPDFARRIASEGLEPAGGTPEEFLALIKREIAEWAEVVREAKLTLN